MPPSHPARISGGCTNWPKSTACRSFPWACRTIWRRPSKRAPPAYALAPRCLERERKRLSVDSNPDVPEVDWYKDFGSFKIWGDGLLPKTFLLHGRAAKGKAV